MRIKNFSMMASPVIAVVLLSSCGSNSNTAGINTATTAASATTISGALQVESLNPPAGMVSTLPASVEITFSETNLDLSTDASSALSVSNYSINCGGSTYNASSAQSEGNGIVILTLPLIPVSSGAICTLTASNNIQDTSGNALSGTVSETYDISSSASSSSSWYEQPTATLEGPAGDAWTGSAFYDEGVSGIAVSGLSINSGAYIDQITGIWETGFSTSSNQISGPSHGGYGGSSDGDVMCPAGEQVSGIFGTYTSQVNSLGIICGTPGQPSAYTSSTYGETNGTSFQLTCPSGEFVTDLGGFSGSYLQEIEIGCR